MNAVEKWGVFEVSVSGKTDKNPFVDYDIQGTFAGKNETVTTDGFYDGNGVYKVRFMPSFEGEYTYKITGSFSDREETGSFVVTAPSENNHGPVRVANSTHFVYEDGTPYYSVGTTCYVWTHQSQELQQKTLETLSKGYFNKIRFCIFPKHYDYNLNEPITYPFVGKPMDSSVLTKENFMEYDGACEGNEWDFTHFDPKHFQLFEQRIQDLMDMGIEADLIVMHPYDRWGFSEMSQEDDDRYWKYVIARFAAYRNVWWSLANEYDLLKKKTLVDWERYAKIICEKDPYNHPRSIHNCRDFYDHNRPWITHCSLQRQDRHKSTEFTLEYAEKYKKPIVWDEICYEGNISHCWGNISGEELVRRFWEAAIRGGYAGHGETYEHPEDILWWSHGGELHGTSPERLKFLHQIMCETPGVGLAPLSMPVFSRGTVFGWDDEVAIPYDLAYRGSYYLIYFGYFRPAFREYHLDDINEYEVEVIDTWEMTVKKVGVFKGKFRVELPGKEYMAIRIRKLSK